MMWIKRILNRVTIFAVVALFFVSLSATAAKRGGVSGFVRCGGKGVAGVVVSDGVNVTKTGKNGSYSLPADSERAQFVHISIPSGYEVSRNGSIPQFYGRIEQGVAKQTFNFDLTKVDQSRYTLMTMSDTHILRGTSSAGCILDVERYTTQMIPEINDYASKLGHPVYMVHLGDIGLRTSWKHRRGGYTLADYVSDTKLNMPVFNTVGNHDHDIPKKGERFDDATVHHSRNTFHSAIGPSYYSFNIGSEHYVVLDNSFVITSDSGPTQREDAVKGYQYRVDDVQMEWLKRDIAQIDKSRIRKIVVLVHCPILLNNTQYRMMYAEKFLDSFKGYDVMILAGHSHIDSSIRRTYNGKEMIQNIHASSAGTFWYTPWSCDGTPGGSVAYHFGGEKISRDYVAWGEAKGKKYLVYDNVNNKWNYRITKFTGDGITYYHDLVKAHVKNEAAVLVNVFGAYECSFTESTGGKGKATNKVYDLNFRDWHWAEFEKNMNGEAPEGHRLQNAGHQRPRKGVPHTWRYIPADPKAVITVEAKDVFGNVIATFTTQAAN